MMFRHLIPTGLALSLALIPMSTFAYVTPDEALNQQNLTTNFFSVPPTIRGIPDVVKQQQLDSAARRQAALDAIKPHASSSSSEDLHGAASDSSQTDIDKMIELMKLMQSGQSASASSQTPGAGLDPVTQRLLIRVQAQQQANVTAAERAALIQSLGGQDQTLHSGAPLTQSGPASVVVMLAVAAAIAETWRRVRKSEKARL